MNCLCHRLNGFVGRMLLVLVVLSFGSMVGYSDLLHSHDADFQETHEDCKPCKWNQSNSTVETEILEARVVIIQKDIQEDDTLPAPSNVLIDRNGRSPPLFS